MLLGTLDLLIQTPGGAAALREMRELDATAAATSTRAGTAFSGLASVARGAFAGIATAIVGVGLGQVLGAAVDASNRLAVSMRVLDATSRQTGVPLATLQRTSEALQRSLGLTATNANTMTATAARFTGVVGRANDTGLFLTRWLDLAASRGLSAADAMQALETTLAGNDEGLNRIGLRNPGEIYKSWGAGADDASRKAAIYNEVLTQGEKVTGAWSSGMATAQGAVERLNAAKETFLVTLGLAITNGAGYKSGVDAMTGALQGMTTWVNENRDGISGLVRDLASLTAALITAFGWVSKIASVSFRNSSFGMLASMLGGGRAPDVPTAMTEGANPFAGTTSFGGELATGFGGFALHTLGGGTMARGSGTLAPMTHTPTAAEKAAAERAERTAFQNEQFDRAQRLMAGVTNISGGGFTSLAAPLQIAPQRMPRLDIPVSALGQQLGRMGERVDRAFGSFGTDAASAFAKSLTAGFTAIANGPITFGNFFRSMGGALLGGLGSIFTQVGEMLVEYGIAMTNLLPFLTNIFTSGPAALVAGGLLIALGSAFGGAFTGGGRGRGGGGGGGGSFSGGGAGGDVFRGIVLSPRAAPVGGQFAPTGRTGTPATAQPIVNNFTVIGEGDPRAQRSIANMVASASRRGIA